MSTFRLLSAFLAATTFAAAAAVSPIRVDVYQATKSGGKSAGGTNQNASRSQQRELRIKVVNTSSETFGNLVVKYWFFARDLKSKEEDIHKNGERKVALGARTSETVESEAVSSSYVEEHFQYNNNNNNRGGNRGGNVTATKVPASGAKITGYAVQVLNDGKVMAEFYSEERYRRQLAGEKK